MRLELYEDICTLYESNEKQVLLVRDKLSQIFYVKKHIYKLHNRMIYNTLKENPHPHLVQVIGVMQKQDMMIVIEEFVNGISLEYRLSQGPCTQQECIKIFGELFSVLAHLHQLQPSIVHRDIKPGNIFLDGLGHVKLMDMEIARRVQANKQKDTCILGSSGYAAPEQYGFTQTDARSDIYAIGVLIKELYYGDIATNLPRTSLTSVIQRCMMMEPNERYQTIEELQQAYHKAAGVEEPIDFVNTNTTDLSFIEYLCKHSGRIILYLLFFLISVNVTLEGDKPPAIYELWIMRISFFIGLSSIIWITKNYGGVRDYIPFCRSRILLIRLCSAVILWITSVIFILIIGVIVNGIIQSML